MPRLIADSRGASTGALAFLITASTPGRLTSVANMGGSTETRLPAPLAFDYCVTVTLRMRDMVSPSLSISNSRTGML
jgi:hypothetical protein